ncbi:MAG: hypothetical protein ACLRWQ_05715 [Flavonifractor plautii]
MTAALWMGRRKGSWCWLAWRRGDDVYTLDTEGLAVDGPLADGRWWRSGFRLRT